MRPFTLFEPNLEPPEPSVVCTCAQCGGDIYRGEVYGFGEKGYFCIDCLRDELRELNDKEVIELLGLEVCGDE